MKSSFRVLLDIKFLLVCFLLALHTLIFLSVNCSSSIPSSEGTPSQLHRQIQAIILAEFFSKSLSDFRSYSDELSQSPSNRCNANAKRPLLGSQSAYWSERTNAEQSLLGKRIVKRIEEECGVLFTECERNYVLGQIVGKRVIPKNEKNVVSEEVSDLVRQVQKNPKTEDKLTSVKIWTYRRC